MGEFASCCLLSYNRPLFVETAIRTAVANADYPLEMIVHDDGSNPETISVLWALQAEGLISTLITNPEGYNQGQGIALNRMFHMAKGDPIIKLDHDLIFMPGWLRAAKTILDTNKRAIEQPRIGALGLFKYFAEPVHHEAMFLRSFDGWEQHRDFVGSAMVIPRAAWEKFGPFEERSTAFAEDHAFKMKVTSEDGWCCALPPDPLADNQGFGLGPSTVVVQKEDGSLTSRQIKQAPYIIGGDGV